MVASRNRPKGVRVGPFGLSVLVLSLVPTQLGYQDLAALLIRQQDVTQRARAHALASPFGTIHAATFSFPRPIGTLIPPPPAYRLAGLDVGELDVTGSLAPDFPGIDSMESRPVEYPTVNRRLKGDLLVPRPQPQPQPTGTRDMTPGRVKTVSFPRPVQDPRLVEEPRPSDGALSEATVLAEQPAAEPDAEPSLAAAPQTYAVASLPEPMPSKSEDAFDPIEDATSTVRFARLYFFNRPVGTSIGPIKRWPGDEPILMTPAAADPDIKRSALAPVPKETEVVASQAGETIAPKGEVTGAGKRPKSPAERLGLDVKGRAKAEKCLAEAVYFESRGETKRGQIAVAQVVMNRVFSGYYPNNVCEVVYQNAHRYNACQFTFACDRVKDVVNDPPLWAQAKEIARDTLDGKLWLHDIGKSTHYHAYWVHPWWVGTMRKLSRIGVHTFYRPKRWGDGAEAPAWGQGITAANVNAASL